MAIRSFPFLFLAISIVIVSAYRAIIADTLRQAQRPTATKHKALWNRLKAS